MYDVPIKSFRFTIHLYVLSYILKTHTQTHTHTHSLVTSGILSLVPINFKLRFTLRDSWYLYTYKTVETDDSSIKYKKHYVSTYICTCFIIIAIK